MRFELKSGSAGAELEVTQSPVESTLAPSCRVLVHGWSGGNLVERSGNIPVGGFGSAGIAGLDGLHEGIRLLLDDPLAPSIPCSTGE